MKRSSTAPVTNATWYSDHGSTNFLPGTHLDMSIDIEPVLGYMPELANQWFDCEFGGSFVSFKDHLGITRRLQLDRGILGPIRGTGFKGIIAFDSEHGVLFYTNVHAYGNIEEKAPKATFEELVQQLDVSEFYARMQDCKVPFINAVGVLCGVTKYTEYSEMIKVAQYSEPFKYPQTW